MKHMLTFLLLTALLGGCAVVPLGYGYRGDGYSRGNGYYRGDGYQRDNGYNRGYGDRGYGDRGYGDRGYGYQDRGR